ncbi:MAG: Nif3-like dinuclear metal center hexameric protein [Bacteroidia bacterium]|nr:Nif3-like dinuclear metal center hexameric protein [Bacteroidia bacterium]MDW8302589.1 Nif3-like dinuclear metal center hexameric protein [Bacteroidia bacterium]
MKVQDLISYLQEVAPAALKEDYDNVGLLIGEEQTEIKGILTALELNHEVINEAKKLNCNVIITHHPIIFRPLKKITLQNYNEQMVYRCIQEGIAVYAMHTNFDHVFKGTNYWLAKSFALSNLKPLRKLQNYYKVIVTFVPTQYVSQVRSALAQSGAGVIGNYTECSYNVQGYGTFRPNQEAQPFSGVKNQLSQEVEVRLEMRFPAYLERQIIKALHQSHPYETPAYHIFADHSTQELYDGAGIIGELPTSYTPQEFLKVAKQVLKIPFLRYTYTHKKKIQRVALCGGAGSFLISDAVQQNADAFITADITYHTFFDVPASLMLIDGGHYETEQYVAQAIAHIISQKFESIPVYSTQVNTNPVLYF